MFQIRQIKTEIDIIGTRLQGLLEYTARAERDLDRLKVVCIESDQFNVIQKSVQDIATIEDKLASLHCGLAAIRGMSGEILEEVKRV